MARLRAPQLTGAGGWIGTSEPLSLAALAGKIVVLDFWTSSCVYCLRVLEELRPIERRFADEAVIVGIHSPKFPREHDHQAVVEAVARHRVTHPVLDDPDLVTWQQYGVRGWPTVVVIDPEGYIVGGVSGEGCATLLTQTLEGLIATHDADGTLVRGPLPALVTGPGPAVPSPSAPARRGLAYPGKVAVEPSGRRLAIADTGHDRVLLCDLQGRVERVFGDLRAPQGLCFDAERLVVCDTGADRVVTIDLNGGTVQTVAAGIASPWDVIVDRDGTYLVAEAGRHRLRRIDGEGTAAEAAGTGQENLVDGAADHALLAQPSGLARLPGQAATAFVDAESSALRVMTDDGRVLTLVGQGLFDWGASDGGPESSALQHPLGLTAAPDGTLYVADTFNSLVRAWSGTSLTAQAGTLRTLPVEGLEEPGGLDMLGDGRLVVADTNHHRIVLVDVSTGTVEPIVIEEGSEATIAGTPLTTAGTIRVPYEIDPEGMDLDLTAGPPVRIEVSAMPPTLLGPGPRRWELNEARGVLELPAGDPGTGTLVVAVTASLCAGGECTVRRSRTGHDLTVIAEDPPATPE